MLEVSNKMSIQSQAISYNNVIHHFTNLSPWGWRNASTCLSKYECALDDGNDKFMYLELLRFKVDGASFVVVVVDIIVRASC